MNLAKIRSLVEIDLRLSPADTVLYLEGKTDIEYLFALLGRPRPPDDGNQNCLHGGVLVKEPGMGSGSSAVRSHVEVGKQFSGDGLIIGITDGDGLPVDQLAPAFDAPHTGPLFTWKTYCIENLLAKTGWPASWGDEPDWPAELVKYGPYVALNRVGSEARAILKDLGLASFLKPILGESLRPSTEISAALAAGKARLLSFDVEEAYREELSNFEATVRRSLDETHALIDGKWIVRHMAPTITKRDPDICEFEWLAHSRSVGGLPEVRDWWQRVTGNPP